MCQIMSLMETLTMGSIQPTQPQQQHVHNLILSDTETQEVETFLQRKTPLLLVAGCSCSFHAVSGVTIVSGVDAASAPVLQFTRRVKIDQSVAKLVVTAKMAWIFATSLKLFL